MQAVIQPRKVSIGEIILEGGIEYLVRHYEAIKSPITKRTKHIHWCDPIGAVDTKATIHCPSFLNSGKGDHSAYYKAIPRRKDSLHLHG